MVETLAAAGAVTRPEVLAAMGRVPREAFVPRFWTQPPPLQGAHPADFRQFNVAQADEALSLIYDIDRALGIRIDPAAQAVPSVTSAASAPRIVGAMLELLDLQPGMTVLEIGTGSGYNAALLRELVGPSGSVTSVDIDRGLIDEAAQRLNDNGYDDVVVAASDGYFGMADRGPFDRIVATVGCIDLAPAWQAQLADGGFCLLPLEHGGWHPLTRIEPTPKGVIGTVVGRSGFVRIQGHQAGSSPWRSAGQLDPREVVWSPLPDDLVDELKAEPGREAIGGRGIWDLAFFLGLEVERRSASVLTVAEDGSTATIDPRGTRAGWTGSLGPRLHRRILDVAKLWIDTGRPSIHDYMSTFSLLAEETPTSEQSSRGRWSIERLDFRQTVTLQAELPSAT
jgi:protein-L-isoaspartate(D-aspartate) O-methyltransferase